jgi:hypothetical protein
MEMDIVVALPRGATIRESAVGVSAIVTGAGEEMP